MNKFAMTAFAVSVAFSSAAAFAGEEVGMDISDSLIIQIQEGNDLTQDATIGQISSDFKGKAWVSVAGSGILQAQKGHDNLQTASIGTICDCDPEHGGKKH